MTDKERAVIEAARDRVGPWLSAALDDPDVCAEMKADINALFDALAALDADKPSAKFDIANCPDCGKFRGHGHVCKETSNG